MDTEIQKIENALEDIDEALTQHYRGGRGWIGFVLAMSQEQADVLKVVSSHREIRHLRQFAVSFLKGHPRKGFITINLQGKVVGGGMNNFKMPIHIVDLLIHPKVIPQRDVKEYVKPIEEVGGALPQESTTIEPDLLEVARTRGIEVDGKTREQLMEEIFG
jgi:hypothetical protein